MKRKLLPVENRKRTTPEASHLQPHGHGADRILSTLRAALTKSSKINHHQPHEHGADQILSTLGAALTKSSKTNQPYEQGADRILSIVLAALTKSSRIKQPNEHAADLPYHVSIGYRQGLFSEALSSAREKKQFFPKLVRVMERL